MVNPGITNKDRRIADKKSPVAMSGASPLGANANSFVVAIFLPLSSA